MHVIISKFGSSGLTRSACAILSTPLYAPEDRLGSPQPANQPRAGPRSASTAGAFGRVDWDKVFLTRVRGSETGMVDEVGQCAVALFRLEVARVGQPLLSVSPEALEEEGRDRDGDQLTSGCVTASTMLFSQDRKTGLAASGEKAEKSRKVWTVNPPLMSRTPSDRRGASAAPNRNCVAGDRSDGIETCNTAPSERERESRSDPVRFFEVVRHFAR